MSIFNENDSIYTTQPYKPTFFRIRNEDEKILMDDLFKKGAQKFDQIHSQLCELIKSRNPKVDFTTDSLNDAVKVYLAGRDLYEYGVWVYYPWSSRLVHILDEDEFIEVRTSRNQHKITKAEQEALLKRKIGVVGLSVGQSVSVTLALERICGELRLADFDILELSNLNRIRTGLHNLGIKKTISVAREISEIDPYIKVVCYNDGLDENNIEDFLLQNGKLDILVEECDGLDIKVLCRQKAKAFQIPVVMEASDRGTIDIERFDLEPERSILHGFIDHLDVSQIKNLKTNEEKVPFLLPIAGAETISHKAKACMIEVAQSITTWPQLGSAVTFGGGLTVDVCRRILLDEFTDSGRYFIDLEELIKNKNHTEAGQKSLKLVPPMSDEEINHLIKEAAIPAFENQLDLSEEEVTQIVEAGVMAPTGANAQPWKWRYHNKNLYLFFDIVYIAQLLDFEGTTSYIGLGAAAENIILKSHALGYELKQTKFPAKNTTKLIAVFSFFKKEDLNTISDPEMHVCDELAEVISKRVTNRKITPRKKFDQTILDDFKNIAQTIPGAELKFIDDDNGLHELGEIIAKVDRIRIMHEGGHQDFLAEMRWTPEQAAMMRNGVDINTIDLTPSEFAGFQMAKHWGVINYLNKWKGGTALEKFSRKTAASASAIGLITMPEFSPLDFYEGGRAVERVWLHATKKNIAFQPVTIATLIFNTFLYEKAEIFPIEMKNELNQLRNQFEKIFSLNKKGGEIMLFRIFNADVPDKRSLRVSVSEVLSFTKNIV